jgi:5-methylcytosine-specific restriction endonuclease McrA
VKRPCIDCGRVTTGTRCPGCASLEHGHRAVYHTAAWRQLARAVVAGATSCHWCGRSGVRLSGDHVVGARRHPERALDPSNVVAACFSCQNRRRGGA